jgi:hypothetical protein
MSNTLWPAPVQHCKIVLGCKIPHELDALKWKATGRRREEDILLNKYSLYILLHITHKKPNFRVIKIFFSTPINMHRNSANIKKIVKLLVTCPTGKVSFSFRFILL